MTSPLPRAPHPLAEDAKTSKKIAINHRRNLDQDQTELLDAAGKAFVYGDARDAWWNPEEFSLLHGTPLWDEATRDQRLALNQLYWVAYYAQIISAEIATIYFNQTSAAGLYGLDDFRGVADMLDSESRQERAHIAAFRAVGEQVEAELFGERVFTQATRGPFAETMLAPDSGPLRERWKKLQLQSFGMLSAGNAFIACQYFTVRGLRTLNGKMVQGKLSAFHQKKGEERAVDPIPSKISYYHFMDESFHFNSSTILGHEVLRSLPKPTRFEASVANLALLGCQRDHARFSIVVRGLFWNDPATFPAVYKLLRSRVFGMGHDEALRMMERCFAQENAAIHAAAEVHATARASYQKYLDGLDYVWRRNREMAVMGRFSVPAYLAENRAALRGFAGAA